MDMKKREELSIMPRFLARATGEKELPFTETKTVGRADLGEMDILISVKFKMLLNIQVMMSSRWIEHTIPFMLFVKDRNGDGILSQIAMFFCGGFY